MMAALIILALVQTFVISVIVWLCYSVIEARSEMFEAIAARQRAEVQLHETSREFIEYRRMYGNRDHHVACDDTSDFVAGDSPSAEQEEAEVRDGRTKG